MELLNELAGTVRELWPHIVATVSLVLMVVATAHVVMYKKDTRAAIGWAGVILIPHDGQVALGLRTSHAICGVAAGNVFRRLCGVA